MKRLLTACVIMSMTMALPAQAHTETELDTWFENWSDEAEEALTVQLLAEYRDMTARHSYLEREPIWVPAVSVFEAERPAWGQKLDPGWNSTVEHWRPIVERHFAPGDVSWAMAVIRCESGGNPDAKNPNSSASGLFQHLARYWGERSSKADIPGASIWDPESNVRVAAWLVYEGGGKGHWNASRSCWG